jgi:hypothetical protein
LERIETLDLFRRACYNRNASYRKINGIKVLKNFQFSNSIQFSFDTQFIQRWCRSCKKRSTVSMRS